jgi:hypothetical protein
MFTFDMQFANIHFLSGFSDKQIVDQLLAGARNYPAYDRLAVSRETNSIRCDFFQNDVQVARVRAVGPRF